MTRQPKQNTAMSTTATKKTTTKKNDIDINSILKEAKSFEPVRHTKGKRSALEPLSEIIRVLREDKNAPYEQITQFLEKKGVKTSTVNLRQFVAKRYPHLVNTRDNTVSAK